MAQFILVDDDALPVFPTPNEPVIDTIEVPLPGDVIWHDGWAWRVRRRLWRTNAPTIWKQRVPVVLAERLVELSDRAE